MKKLRDKQKVFNLKKSLWAMQRLSRQKLNPSYMAGDEETKLRNLNHSDFYWKPYNSRIINRLANLISRRLGVKKVTANIQIPSNFSLIDNPIPSLEAIYKLANTARSKLKIKRFIIDHSTVDNIDLAAESIFDQVAAEIEREYKSRTKKLQFSGVYPNSERLKRLLRGIGIIKSLKIEHEYLSQSQKNKIEVFVRKAKKYKADVGSLSYVELTTKNFVDHINKCLNRIGRELTDGAVDRLSTYTGEIIGNADEHSGESSWFVVGYYDHHDDSHLCEIAIFNFGKTFAETFMELPEDSFAFKAINPYIIKHETNKYFNHSWDKQDLLTLVALQGDISSKNENKDGTRGNGSVEMIEFFDRISKECSGENAVPEMAIISGSTHIKFDGKYPLVEDNRGRKIIAFNSQNDLTCPPDDGYVSNLAPLYFPGALISLRFPLSESQVSEIEK